MADNDSFEGTGAAAVPCEDGIGRSRREHQVPPCS
jgi:hypothetical protein